MKSITTFLLIFIFFLLSLSTTLSVSTRPEPKQDQKTSNPASTDGIPEGFFPPGFGGIPGFGSGWSGGYGSGFGGPGGGYSKGGVVRPTVVCRDKGPCFGKMLRCPAKCFSSYSRSGKGYGYGGGGGGCTMDCKNRCIAYC